MIKLISFDGVTELLSYIDRSEFDISCSLLPDMIIGKSCMSHKLVNNMKDTYFIHNCTSASGYPNYCLPNLIDISREFELTQKNKLVSAGINTPIAFMSGNLKSFIPHTYTDLDSLYVISISGTTRGYGKWLMSKRNIITLFEYIRTFNGEISEFIKKIKELTLEYRPRKVSFEDDKSTEMYRDLYDYISRHGQFPMYIMESLTNDPNLLKYIQEFRVLLFKSHDGANYIIRKRNYAPFTKEEQESYMYTSDVLRNDEIRNILYKKHKFLKETNEFINDKLVPFLKTKVNVPFLAMDVYCNPTKNGEVELGVFEYDSSPNVVYPAETYIKTSKTTGVSIDWTNVISQYVTKAMKQHIKEM